MKSFSRQANFFDSNYSRSDIALSNQSQSLSNFRNEINRFPNPRYKDKSYIGLQDTASSFRSVSTPPSVISLPTRLENTNRSILAVIRLCFFLAFWILIGCISVAFLKDVLNRLEQEREKQKFEVDICLNDYKSKIFINFLN